MDKKGSKLFNSGFKYFFIALLCWTVIGFVLLLLEKDKSIYRAINDLHTPLQDKIFPLLTYLGTFPFIAICLLGFYLSPRFRTFKFTLFVLVCNLAPFLILRIFKNIINRPRPLNYFNNAEWINKVTGQPENFNLSFPSGHSEGIFALCCFLALFLPKKWAIFGFPLFLVGLSVAYSRMYLSQHFYEDIFAGSLIGGYGVLFCYLMMKDKIAKVVNK